MADDGQAKDNNKEQQDSESRKKPQDVRRKRRIRFIVLAILVIAAIAAIPIYSYYSVRESTDDAQVDGHIVPISPRINGTIIKVLVNDNQQVKQGQDLVWLDPADYQVAYDQAKAQYASAVANTAESKVNVPLTDINTRSSVRSELTLTQQGEAAVSSAEQAVSAAEARLTSAKGALASKQADLVKAEKDLARTKDLVEKDEISRQEYDAAVAARDSDKADVDSAAADVIEAQHTLDQNKAQVVQAKAKLAQAIVEAHQAEQVAPKQVQVSEARHQQALAAVQQREADIEQARLNLNYTIIKAPIDGRVSRKTAEPGMQVSPGQQIMALVPLWDVWITANFKETQLRHMRVGQAVEIEVDTFGGKKFHGHIDSIAAASGARFSLLPPENATGNYVKVVQRVPVKIFLDKGEDPDHTLLPGMSVTPTVLLNTAPGAH
ncbi:MAG TPA: HlyD family secretion protein [Bryobacteraceae bacterium]|jgi:membrane fusion protein (multidrug efflux system)|nr:HlyD family secretion protein [Bryobacteraceae bacterium]